MGAPAASRGAAAVAARLTGLPPRRTTTALGVLIAVILLAWLLIQVAAIGPAIQGGWTDLGTALVLVAVGGVAESAQMWVGRLRVSSSNPFLVAAAVLAPAPALLAAGPAMWAGMALADRRETLVPMPMSDRTHLVRTGVSVAVSVQTMAIGLGSALLVAGPAPAMASPRTWLAVAVGSIAVDLTSNLMAQVLTELGRGQRPGRSALWPPLPDSRGHAAVSALLAPVVCAAAAVHVACVAAMTVPLVAWSRTADRADAQRSALLSDPSSGLPTRPPFLEEGRLLDRGARSVTTLQVVDLDLVEQALSVPVADAVLHQVGQRLLASAPGLLVGHLTRDTFAVAAVEQEQPALAERLADELGGSYRADGTPVHVRLVAGVAVDGTTPAPFDSLVLRAESALRGGHGRVRCADAEVPLSTAEELALVDELATAIDDGQIGPWYQPLVTAQGPATLVAGEALARWDHPTRGVLAPSEWLPHLVRMGLDERLTGIMLDRVAADMAAWDRDHQVATHVSVNISAPDLARGGLVQAVGDACARHGVDPSRLTIEITEQAATADPAATSAAIAALQALGCRVAIDDFGVAHSSLGRLASLGADELKIDRTLITGTYRTPRTVAVVRALVQLGHALGMTVVAEGVEDSRDARFAAGIGCHKLQGYGIGRPTTGAGFIADALAAEEAVTLGRVDQPVEARSDLDG